VKRLVRGSLELPSDSEPSVVDERSLKEALEREKATREILRVISDNRADEAPVFDAILENARRLCDAPFAGLYLVDDAGTHAALVASQGARSAYLASAKTKWPLDADTSVPLSIVGKRVVHAADLADTDAYRRGDQQRVEAVDIEGIRTFLAVPLLKEGNAIGCIGLYRREVKPFEESQIGLVKTFAEQAVIAVDNVRQFKALETRTEEVMALNQDLEKRVAAQVSELERMGRLKRFLPPAVADAIVSSGDDSLLSSHRALVAVLFCDIRGFTAFCETAEPEEAIDVLQRYHEEMGVLITDYGAGVDHRSGDGIMVIFNDPLPCDDPGKAALELALAMRNKMASLCSEWRKLGHRLGFGVGISLGYATVGIVGSAGRFDYTASGTTVNLASRLCDHASDGEILLSPRAYAAVEKIAVIEEAGAIALKGIQTPVEVFRVVEVPATHPSK
jgi:class 3 adenylate cyclase